MKSNSDIWSTASEMFPVKYIFFSFLACVFYVTEISLGLFGWQNKISEDVITGSWLLWRLSKQTSMCGWICMLISSPSKCPWMAIPKEHSKLASWSFQDLISVRLNILCLNKIWLFCCYITAYVFFIFISAVSKMSHSGTFF